MPHIVYVSPIELPYHKISPLFFLYDLLWASSQGKKSLSNSVCFCSDKLVKENIHSKNSLDIF